MTIKCPFCECVEISVIGRKQIRSGLTKITYHCPSCRNEWGQMKGYARLGKYYWHNGEHRRIPENAKVKVLGGINVWSNRIE